MLLAMSADRHIASPLLPWLPRHLTHSSHPHDSQRTRAVKDRWNEMCRRASCSMRSYMNSALGTMGATRVQLGAARLGG